MTDIESALQSILDKDPTDQTTRMMLAEHLWDIGDPRAKGYEELARLDRWPWRTYDGWYFDSAECHNKDMEGRFDHSGLHIDWYKTYRDRGDTRIRGVIYSTRREAEDCAALTLRVTPHPTSLL